MFQPIKFTYNPPKTIPAAPAALRSAEEREAVAVAVSGSVPKTRVQSLMAQAAVLSETSKYLQQVIKETAAATVVPVDPARQPEVAQALQRIYGEVPAGISVAMYDNVLDTYMAAQQAEISMRGLDSGLKILPVQVADLQTVINEYEQQVVKRGDFEANATVLLNQLKGDDVILDQIHLGLKDYGPPEQIQAGASPDVSEDLHDDVKQRLDAWQTYYSVTHAIVTEVDSIYDDIYEITQKYFYQPIDLLLKLVAALSALKGLFHKPKLGDIRASLVWLVYPRLISEVTKYTFLLDRLISKAVDPVFQVLGSVDSLFAQVCKVASDAAYLIGKGNFKGLRQEIGYAWDPSKAKQAKRAVSELDKLSKGFASFQGHIGQAVQTARIKRERTKRSMLKLLDRRLIGTADRLETLESLRSAESAITILQAMASEADRMAPGNHFSQQLNQPLGSFGRQIGEIQGGTGSLSNIIGNVEQGANLSISLQANNKAVVTKKKKPTLKPPPPVVEQALADNLPERDDNGNE